MPNTNDGPDSAASDTVAPSAEANPLPGFADAMVGFPPDGPPGEPKVALAVDASAGSEPPKSPTDKPIEARPPSTWYQARKFAQRNLALVGGVLATVIALVVGLAGSLTFALREVDARKAEGVAKGEANKRAEELERVVEFQSKRLSKIVPSLMASRLKVDLVTARRESFENRAADESEIDAAVGELDVALAELTRAMVYVS